MDMKPEFKRTYQMPPFNVIFPGNTNYFPKRKYRKLTVLRPHVRILESLKATFHLTISMSGQRATGKIQRNNYHHGSCGPPLTGKTMSVFLIFTQGTHRNVKNR